MHLVALGASIYGAQGDSLFGLTGAKVKHLQVVLNQVTDKSTFFQGQRCFTTPQQLISETLGLSAIALRLWDILNYHTCVFHKTLASLFGPGSC